MVDAFCADQASPDGVVEWSPKGTPKRAAKAAITTYIKDVIVPKENEKNGIDVENGERIACIYYVKDVETDTCQRLNDDGTLSPCSLKKKGSRSERTVGLSGLTSGGDKMKEKQLHGQRGHVTL